MGRWWWFRRVLVGSSKTGPAARNSNPRRRHRLRSFASLRMTERSRERPGRRASGFESRIKRDKETRIRREKNRKSRKEAGPGVKPETPPLSSAAVEFLRSGVGYS